METIAIVATCIAILTGILSVVLIIRSGGQKSGTQDADIKYIKDKVDDILLDNRDTNRMIMQHETRIAVAHSTSPFITAYGVLYDTPLAYKANNLLSGLAGRYGYAKENISLGAIGKVDVLFEA